MKTRIASIGVIFIAALALAVVGTWWYGTQQAEKQVRQAFVEADLLHRIDYGRVTYNPLTGAATIHDLRPRGADETGLDPSARALEILDWTMDDEIAEAIHLRLVDLKLDVRQAARQYLQGTSWPLALLPGDEASKILEEPLLALVVLGYLDVVEGVEVDYRYDRNTRELSLAVAQAGKNIGELNLEIAFAGVEPKVLEALPKLVEKAFSGGLMAIVDSMQMLSGLQEELKRVALVDLQLSYRDAGLVCRIKEFHDVQTLRSLGTHRRWNQARMTWKG